MADASTNGKAVEVVEMSDGRKVEFVGKRRLLKEVILNEDGSFAEVRFDFRNGETRSFTGVDGLTGQALGHGWSQKIGDETASEEDVDDMVLAVDGLIDRLNQGEWRTARESGGMSGTSVLLRALVEFSGKSVEAIKAYLKDKTPADKMAMRAENKRRNSAGHTVKAIVERLEAEKAAKSSKIDTEALFDQLGGV